MESGLGLLGSSDEEEEEEEEEELIVEGTVRGGSGVGGGPPAGPRRVSPLGVPGVANDANVIVHAAADVAYDIPADSILQILRYVREMRLYVQQIVDREGPNGVNICPLTSLYPQDGVHWNVGPRSLQVFERSELIRWIHNVSRDDIRRDFLEIVEEVISMKHPLNYVSTLRSVAMSLIEEISFGRRQILRVLRESSGEPMNDPDLRISDEEMEEKRSNLGLILRHATRYVDTHRAQLAESSERRAQNRIQRRAESRNRDVNNNNIGNEGGVMNGGLGIRDGANIEAGDRNVRARIEVPMNQPPQDPDPHAPAPPVEQLLSESESSAISDDSVLRIHVVQPRGRGGGRGRGRGRGGRGGGRGRGGSPRPVADAAIAADGGGASSRRVPLGSFLNVEKSDIRDTIRATALIDLLALAANHNEGFIGSLGHGNRSDWFAANIDLLFAEDGPLSAFTQVQPGLLMRNVGHAERLAQRILSRSHSDEPSGAGQEVIPAWVTAFRPYFEAQLDNPSASVIAGEARVHNRTIVRGIMGGQAPLGRHDSNNPVQLRTEIDSNIGGTQQQQMVGQFESHFHDQDELINILQPGMNDVVQQQQQQQQPQQDTSQLHPVPRGPRSRPSGMRRRNTHNPLEQFSIPHPNYSSMDQGLFSLGRLTDVVSRAFENPPLRPARTMQDAEEDYYRVTDRLNGTSPDDTLSINLYNSLRQRYANEIHRFGAAMDAEIESRNDVNGSNND